MKKLEAMFKSDPPKMPLESLEAIVADWNYRFGKNGKEAHRRDMVVEFCRDAGSLQEAIKRACKSRDAAGKMHNHQSRVTELARSRFSTKIFAHLRKPNRPASFDELHDLFEAIAPEGIGPVTIYDVSTRVGAYLKLEPTSLYLHAGVRVGWAKLHGRRSPAIKRIEKQNLPPALQTLPPDEVEDMLCCYRDYLKPWCRTQEGTQ